MTRTGPLVIVQARTGSRRLPRKVLADLCGAPVLQWLLERLSKTQLATGVVVATTIDPSDSEVVGLCRRIGVPTYRGHPSDVLSRFVAAAGAYGAKSLVRVSADSPLLDADSVDYLIAEFERSEAELVQNHRPTEWPVGTAIEVMTTEFLMTLDDRAVSSRHREHVTLFAYEHPEDFAMRYVRPPRGLAAPALRLCIDTPEDLERVRAICRAHSPDRNRPLAEVVGAAAVVGSSQ